MARLEDRKRLRLLVPMRLCRMQSTSIHPGQPSLFLILSYTTDLMHSFLRGARIANDSVLVSEFIELLLLGDFWLLRLTGSGLSRSTSLAGEERDHRLESLPFCLFDDRCLLSASAKTSKTCLCAEISTLWLAGNSSASIPTGPQAGGSKTKRDVFVAKSTGCLGASA